MKTMHLWYVMIINFGIHDSYMYQHKYEYIFLILITSPSSEPQSTWGRSESYCQHHLSASQLNLLLLVNYFTAFSIHLANNHILPWWLRKKNRCNKHTPHFHQPWLEKAPPWHHVFSVLKNPSPPYVLLIPNVPENHHCWSPPSIRTFR